MSKFNSVGGLATRKKCLIVVCGLRIGGVETYICRLSAALHENNIEAVVLVLSRKSDPAVMDLIKNCAKVVWIDEVQRFKGYTSWLNAFIPLKREAGAFADVYDFVHVVDSLTLHFLALNNEVIRYNAATIGLYHEQEFVWWRDSNVLYRDQQIDLAVANANAILFPNEIIRQNFATDNGLNPGDLPLLPLGVEMPPGSRLASQESLKIVSIGRLVDFKTYNKMVISILPELRKIGNFTYEIYGSGPTEPMLRKLASDCGVADSVVFKGDIAPAALSQALEGAFCFVGSGTTIITAGSYGVPSFVGIESNQELSCGGLFSNVVGYSYNEAACYDVPDSMLDLVFKLHGSSPAMYAEICEAHIRKAREFDIDTTVHGFIASFRSRLVVPTAFRSRIAAAFSVVANMIPIIGPGIFRFKRRYYKR